MSEWDRKIIWIPAVPASGTSAVAGILHHLGVSMGKQDHAAWMIWRGYAMWEDPDFRKFSAEYGIDGAQLEVVAQRHFRIRHYINYRFIQEPEGRLGFKGPATWFDDDHEWPSLPVEILDVYRPLEEAIMSDAKVNFHRTERRPNVKGPPSPLDQRLRAGSLACCWYARAQLFSRIPPTLTVEFNELLENPRLHVEAINEAFDLNASEQQIEEAAFMVNRNLRYLV